MLLFLGRLSDWGFYGTFFPPTWHSFFYNIAPGSNNHSGYSFWKVCALLFTCMCAALQRPWRSNALLKKKEVFVFTLPLKSVIDIACPYRYKRSCSCALLHTVVNGSETRWLSQVDVFASSCFFIYFSLVLSSGSPQLYASVGFSLV